MRPQLFRIRGLHGLVMAALSVALLVLFAIAGVLMTRKEELTAREYLRERGHNAATLVARLLDPQSDLKNPARLQAIVAAARDQPLLLNLVVIDRRFRIVAHTTPGEVGRHYAGLDAVYAVRDGASQVAVEPTPTAAGDLVSGLHVSVPVRGADGVAAVVEAQMDLRAVEDQSRRFLGRLLLFFAGTGFLLLLGSALFLLRFVTSPIDRLLAAVRKLGRGEREVRIRETLPLELGALAIEFNRMADAIENRQSETEAACARLAAAHGAALRAGHLITLGEFSAGVAKEIRSRLTAVETAGMALRERLAEGTGCCSRDDLDALLAALKQAESLGERLLELAQAESAHVEQAEIEAIVRRALRFVVDRARATGVRFDTHVDAGLPVVRWDPVLVQRALLHLLLNALDALPDGGAVEVLATVAREGQVSLSVSDTGPGVPEAERDRIFEFFASTKLGGLGMGLPMVAAIARMHGGTLEYRPRPGGGATFEMVLPVEFPAQALSRSAQ